MPGKINVLFLTVQLETIGGSERLIYNLASQLDRSAFNPSVAWLEGAGILKEFVGLGIGMFHVPKKRRVDFSVMRSISRLIRENNIHIVNAHHFMPMLYSYYGSKIGNRSKLFYTEHSQWEVQQVPHKWQVIGTCLLKKVDGVVGVNPAVADDIQRKFRVPVERVSTVLNGVNIDDYVGEKDRSRIRAGLGLGEREKTIGIVANYKRVKNHLFLVQAFHRLLEEMDGVRLLMIGEGYEGDPENSEQEIREYVRSHGLEKHVLFLGYRADVPDILSVLDVFCLTSLKEGLPLSLIEAMAAGIPVVGTDVEGLRDVIVPGHNGFLVEQADVSGLRDTLYRMLSEDTMRQAMGLNSRILAKERYSLEICVKRYEELFLASMQEKKRLGRQG